MNKLDDILKKAHEIKDFELYDVDKELAAFMASVKQGAPKSPSAKPVKAAWYLSTAAIVAYIILGLLGGYALYQYLTPAPPPPPPPPPAPIKMFETVATTTERDTILMVDGSRIFLDTFSETTYPLVLDGQTERKLVSKGHVKFEVAKNPDLPFIVDQNDLRITVLGTIFDLNQKNNAIEIANLEGKVKAADVNNDKNFKILNKGDKFEYKNGAFTQLDLPKKPVNPLNQKVNIDQLDEYFKIKTGGKISVDPKAKFSDKLRFDIDFTMSYSEILEAVKESGKIKIVKGECEDCYLLTNK